MTAALGDVQLKSEAPLDAALEERAKAEAEEECDEPSGDIKFDDGKDHVNIVFIGHVDAGKSTIGGHLMYLTGNVDKRTLEKYEREAKEKNRESWYLSWALDTNEEERARGKTHEAGYAHFTSEKKHYTIIDAPGHKNLVPNMISGAAQADVAILVISARRGEFESGFEKGGQTREHAMLAKTAGVKHLVVVINKMDDSTVAWSIERFNECKDALTQFLKTVGFKVSEEVTFMPVSGLMGYNLLTPIPEGMCPWYSGPALIPLLDSMSKIVRMLDCPLAMPITDRYRDMGLIAFGKLESGQMKKGQKVVIMPDRRPVVIESILHQDREVDHAVSGENVKVKLKNCEEDDLKPGYVICSAKEPCHVGRIFDAQIVVLEYKSIICPGYTAVLHLHAATEEVVLKIIICQVDKKTGKPDKTKGRPRFMKPGDICIARFEANGVLCMETFKDHPQMGRFTLRDEGKTVAIGKVLKIVEAESASAQGSATDAAAEASSS